MLEAVGLVSLRDERLGTLSRGMDRRLGLACALLPDPHTLVLDDPARGLVAGERRWLYDMLREHAAQGGTVLCSTADPKEAARIADHVVTLDDGRLVADQRAADFARTRLRPRVAVRSPHAARLSALLAQQARSAQRSVEVVQEGGNRLCVYGSSCAEVGETAFRHGIVVHQLADEIGDMGPGAGADPQPNGAPELRPGGGDRPSGPRPWLPSRTRSPRPGPHTHPDEATPPEPPPTAPDSDAPKADPPHRPATRPAHATRPAPVTLPPSVRVRPAPTPCGPSVTRSGGPPGWPRVSSSGPACSPCPLSPRCCWPVSVTRRNRGCWPRGPCSCRCRPPRSGRVCSVRWRSATSSATPRSRRTGDRPRRLGLLTAKLFVASLTALALAVLTVGCTAEVLYLVYGSELVAVPAEWPALTAGWLALVTGCAWAGVLAAGVFRSTTAGLAAVVAVPLLVVPAVREITEGPSVRGPEPFAGRLWGGLPLRRLFGASSIWRRCCGCWPNPWAGPWRCRCWPCCARTRSRVCGAASDDDRVCASQAFSDCNSPGKAHFFPIRRQLRRGERSPFRVLFTKDLKGVGIDADKGCVSTLAHTMMTAARSADSGLATPGELDRYPYADTPGTDRGPVWDGGDPELGRVGGGPRAAADAGCTDNSSSSWDR